MDADTVPYDAEDLAWRDYQVPPPQPAVSQEEIEMAPTLVYEPALEPLAETLVYQPAPDGGLAAAPPAPPPHYSHPPEVAPTIAYGSEDFGLGLEPVPVVPPEAVASEAPTLVYSDQFADLAQFTPPRASSSSSSAAKPPGPSPPSRGTKADDVLLMPPPTISPAKAAAKRRKVEQSPPPAEAVPVVVASPPAPKAKASPPPPPVAEPAPEMARRRLNGKQPPPPCYGPGADIPAARGRERGGRASAGTGRAKSAVESPAKGRGRGGRSAAAKAEPKSRSGRPAAAKAEPKRGGAAAPKAEPKRAGGRGAGKAEPKRAGRGKAAAAPVVTDRGAKVEVLGDGWGAGSGRYEATVTDSDDQTYTVIKSSNLEETVVLKKFVKVLERAPEGKRRGAS